MADDELAGTTTAGYKVGEKKTVDEYQKLDADDEALNRWKQSLGLSAGQPIGDPNDPRTVVIEELALIIEGRPPIVVDLKTPSVLETLKDRPFILKESAAYHPRIKWRVQHDVISGLKYIQVVKRKGIRLEKSEEMLGSYGPNTDTKPVYSKDFPTEEAPSGMLARGTYNIRSRFTDDDGKVHLEFDWTIEIKKGWE
ncbi:hypothetical protein ABW19_dt0210201 [Dactylella cylindrospora]|nr:hypothetical protein ABW19_dt0210201 [Dactylella cylindrospora]